MGLNRRTSSGRGGGAGRKICLVICKLSPWRRVGWNSCLPGIFPSASWAPQKGTRKNSTASLWAGHHPCATWTLPDSVELPAAISLGFWLWQSGTASLASDGKCNFIILKSQNLQYAPESLLRNFQSLQIANAVTKCTHFLQSKMGIHLLFLTHAL